MAFALDTRMEGHLERGRQTHHGNDVMQIWPVATCFMGQLLLHYGEACPLATCLPASLLWSILPNTIFHSLHGSNHHSNRRITTTRQNQPTLRAFIPALISVPISLLVTASLIPVSQSMDMELVDRGKGRSGFAVDLE